MFHCAVRVCAASDPQHVLRAHQTSTGSESYGYGAYGEAEGTGQYVAGLWGFSKGSANEVYGEQSGESSIGKQLKLTAGVWGDTNVNEGTAVLGTADTGTAGFFVNNAGPQPTVQIENRNSSGELFFAINTSTEDSCFITANAVMDCSGGFGTAVAVDGGSRKVAVNAVGSPENWFEDFGSAQLANSVACVEVESVFAQTINSNVEYHVFLTPKDNDKVICVAKYNPSGFEVRESAGGRSNAACDYRIFARRKGYETIRLADKTKESEPDAAAQRKGRGQIARSEAGRSCGGAEVTPEQESSSGFLELGKHTANGLASRAAGRRARLYFARADGSLFRTLLTRSGSRAISRR